MALTKKHFKLFAEMIRNELDNLDKEYPLDFTVRDEIKHIALEIAQICKNENSNFSLDKFLAASGLQEL